VRFEVLTQVIIQIMLFRHVTCNLSNMFGVMWFSLSYFFCFLRWCETWVHLVRRILTGLLYQPQMTDDDKCGAVSGMRIGRGNRSSRRKHAPVPLCPPQIPHDLTWARTRAAEVGSRRLTNTLQVEVAGSQKCRYASTELDGATSQRTLNWVICNY
jgi:hypothetical protein